MFAVYQAIRISLAISYIILMNICYILGIRHVLYLILCLIRCACVHGKPSNLDEYKAMFIYTLHIHTYTYTFMVYVHTYIICISYAFPCIINLSLSLSLYIYIYTYIHALTYICMRVLYMNMLVT